MRSKERMLVQLAQNNPLTLPFPARNGIYWVQSVIKENLNLLLGGHLHLLEVLFVVEVPLHAILSHLLLLLSDHIVWSYIA